MRRVLAALMAALLAAAWDGAAAQTSCRFVLGFAALRESIGPSIVGDCLEDERHGARGDAVQRTTGGLLVWRRFENLASFTDGYRTWIADPHGLRTRLNFERFPWEPPERLSWPMANLPHAETGELARTEAARVLGVSPEAVTVVRVQGPIRWWDAALGCRQPGLIYAAPAIEGTRVLVDVLGRPVHVHVSFGAAIICPNPSG